MGLVGCFGRERRLWLRTSWAKCYFLRLRTLTKEEQAWCTQEFGKSWDGRHTRWRGKLHIQDLSFLKVLGTLGTGVPEVKGVNKVFRERVEKRS